MSAFDLGPDRAPADGARGLPSLAMTREAQEAWSALLERLAPRLVAPEGPDGDRFALALRALASGRRAGAAFCPRPGWVDAASFERLRAEAEASEKEPADRNGKSYGRVGPAALRLLVGKGLRAWAGEALGLRIGRYASASYITYEYAGPSPAASRLHVDLPEYEINCLVGVSHRHPDRGPPSTLRLFEGGPEPRDIDLTPGAAVVFDACRTPHARTALGPGERLTLLTIGLRVEPTEPPRPP
ncbi:MAG TPA: hypothetical protein VFS00_12840 [Polyangiaceae bacterium]|nr:hypothetical protein [Polyangiaceae bacterium]